MVEQFANNASSALSSSINASVTSFTLTSTALFPTSGNFRVVIDSEIMLATANTIGTNTLTVVRAQEGSIAASHSSGAFCIHVVTAGAVSQLKTDTRTIHTITATQTSAYTVLNTDDVVAFSTSGGSFTITLPASPNNGETHIITDVGGKSLVNPLTISGNGHSLVTLSATLATSDTITTNYGSNTYMFNGTFWSLL